MKHSARARRLLAVALVVIAIPATAAWNNPYPAADTGKNILYSAFRERPKHLDPARAYSSNEYEFIAQIYEPPFQYHYLKRPYALVPLTATAVPEPVFLDRQGRRLPRNAPASAIAYSVYEIRIRRGIRYQPHPAFARDDKGEYRYHALTAHELARRYTIADFPHTGTRELTAADYVYQIKRLAHPKLHSPIQSVMNDYIVGLRDYAKTLKQAYDNVAQGRDDSRDGGGTTPGKGEVERRMEQAPRAASGTAAEEGVFLDLRRYPLAGVQEVDRYTYRVTIHGKYPQLLYWMAMPFFAPMPWEADRFFSQSGMAAKNLTLDWYPVGTGAYMLSENNPNRRMVLERNPNYHDERYPAEGEPEDAEKDSLRDAGKPLPFVDKAVFSLEKEGIPYWTKFLQGYYDRSGVLAESFDQAVKFTGSGDTEVSDEMKGKGIRLLTSVATSTYYMGFNMLDPVVGGRTERARKLRQAISIAVDYEEQISIFRNGRGIAAQGALPPGIFGYEEGCAGINPYVYDCVNGQLKRKPIEIARRLLAEAGYPNGADEKTGKPLLLYFDTPAIGPEEKAQLDWTRKQLAKLNIQLVVRATDYNRFQEKMRKGDAQLFIWGWNADYPDPENFLFLLYGPNARVGHDGENTANYENPEFDRLFERMKNMENSPERLAIIRQMLAIARRDAPWLWGVHPKQFLLDHAWIANAKPNHMANNTLKYLRVDSVLRARQREAWNRPVAWPLVALAGLLVAGVISAFLMWKRREKGSAT